MPGAIEDHGVLPGEETMQTKELNAPAEAATQNTEQMLRRILAAVETKHRKGWAELVCALVLALTTMCSAWCAYQSKLWGGLQSTHGGAATAAARKAAELRLSANEARVLEAAIFVRILEARTEGKDQVASFLTSRLRPPTQAALTAWWETDPLKNPQAPRSPFQMPQYKQAESEEAEHQEQRTSEESAAAGVAGRNSDTFVLLTVLFASVLFFGGIGGTLESRLLRRVVLSIAMALFLVTFTALVTMPVAWR
jgi:hypothetical protein